ncbi:protein disulfide-isomerase A4-like [Elephas maximus indicus]|uniref:protein disulfide-isomerase A4-like n=1 Tax=Elephas maximus indicus TaxID=99487 RepID=UPI002115D7B0|nr:protein disulfide-isomerase A4-like [Elephas maximus indicus]
MEPTEFDADALREFVTAFKEGKLKPVIKSQPVPKNNKGPVKVVVGKTFEDIVLDPSKDVLIEFYAPWCGHCKQLEPVYTALGKKYSSHKGLVIAKMDTTANEAKSDHYKVDGFPTTYFAPSEDKKKKKLCLREIWTRTQQAGPARRQPRVQYHLDTRVCPAGWRQMPGAVA